MRSRVVSSGVSGRVTRGDAVRQNGHSGSGAATAIRMRAQLWTATVGDRGRFHAERAIRAYRTALTAFCDLAAGTLPASFQAAFRAAPLASLISSSTDHWS